MDRKIRFGEIGNVLKKLELRLKKSHTQKLMKKLKLIVLVLVNTNVNRFQTILLF